MTSVSLLADRTVVPLSHELPSSIISALGEACLHTFDCFMGDRNSECDTDNTDTCICTANYVEEFTECKSEYIGTKLSRDNVAF